jgi:hypothetical protein
MQMSFSSLSQLVQNYESGGDYTAVNPTSGASGAYQFLDSTWGGYAPQAGVSTILYPTAASAPPAVQDQVFATMVNQRGLADYTCSGCNAPLTNYLAANPDQANLPIFSGEGTLASNSSPDYSTGGASADIAGSIAMGDNPYQTVPTGSAAGSPGASAGAGYPLTLGLQTGFTSAVTGWITGLENSVGTGFDNAVKGALSSVSNWFNRGFLIFIGLVLLGIALIWLALQAAGKTFGDVLPAAALAA